MKTFLCILAVAAVANATIELPSFLGGGGGGSGGRPRGGPRGRGGPGNIGASLVDSLGSGLASGLGEGLGEGLKGVSKLLSGGGPAISTHHQLDHNVNVVHHYANSNGGGNGIGNDGAQVVEVVGDNGGGWNNAEQQEVRVIRVIHEQAAPAHHGHGGGYNYGPSSGSHVQIVKVLHQQAPEPTGW